MGNKKKLSDPLVSKEIERIKELCILVHRKIKEFQTAIFYLDSNQLFQDNFVIDLLAIANDLDELNSLLMQITHPKDIYYKSLRSALVALNSTPNVLIITAHYLKPENKHKRFLNKNTFNFEINSILKKIDFVNQILSRVADGDNTNRGISRPTLDYRIT